MVTTVMNMVWKDMDFEGGCFIPDTVLPWHELLGLDPCSNFLRQVSFLSLNF